MHDYVYPSIFLAYFMFFLFVVGAAFFLVRSRHDGYWGNQSESPKYRMLSDDEAGNGQSTKKY
jgi:hypothetical protein